jgi:hypothetical protein
LQQFAQSLRPRGKLDICLESHQIKSSNPHPKKAMTNQKLSRLALGIVAEIQIPHQLSRRFELITTTSKY